MRRNGLDTATTGNSAFLQNLPILATPNAEDYSKIIKKRLDACRTCNRRWLAMLMPHAAAVVGSFQYTDAARTCSWYEHHHLGGCQRPTPRAGCTQAQLRRAGADRSATQRLAVLIPFRGVVSTQSFAALCEHLPAHLEQQGVAFHLFAVNQVDDQPFNRAALTNAAFRVLMAGGRKAGLQPSDRDPFSCLAVHDVDRFPNRSNQSCAKFTSTYYSCASHSPSILHPESYTGGVLLLRPALFRAVNGFSNDFWGWGHEDNEFYLRLRACGRPPVHAPQLDWCMEHRDCDRCKRAKPAGGLQALQAETRSIALVHGRLADPLRHAATDGVDELNFTTASRPVALPCGKHTLHVLDVKLHRAWVVPDAHRTRPCIADGGANDDGCVAVMAVADLSPRIVTRARRGLPSGSHFRRVVGATRERAMYNFNYEIDMETEVAAKRQVVRVALCAQEWQDRTVPDAVRYQLLWRAVATRGRGRKRADSGAPLRFRVSRNFSYTGHFPCALRQPPVV